MSKSLFVVTSKLVYKFALSYYLIYRTMALTNYQPKGHHKQSMLQKGVMKMFRYEPVAGKFVHKKTKTEKGTVVKKG